MPALKKTPFLDGIQCRDESDDFTSTPPNKSLKKSTALLDIPSGLGRIYSEMVVMALLWHNVVLLRAYHAVLSLVITNVQRAVTPTDYMHNWLHHQNGAHRLSVAHFSWYLPNEGAQLCSGNHLGKFQPASKH